ncbi:MAG: 4Fe-4S binding protein [Desulfomonilaceae bacterium]|nr:4Fe-4S binding protein [Desulfomonilaceae bacterium]
MKWSREAEEAVSKVPFFVRRRVRKRVEEEAANAGSPVVTLEHVHSCRRRFLDNMESEVKGHQLEQCFGPGGCPNRAFVAAGLYEELEELLASHCVKDFLKSRVQGPLKLHHEFRVSISDCPNACSRPQIADLGLIAASVPRVSSEECGKCGACVDACREGAVRIEESGPILDLNQCVACGACIRECPTGTLEEESRGFRIMVGGKLGRHPQLAKELEGVHSRERVLAIVDACIRHFKDHCTCGERFGEILNRTGLRFLDEAR